MTRRFEGKSRTFPCDNGCGAMLFFDNSKLWNGKPRPREMVSGVEQWHSCPKYIRNSKNNSNGGNENMIVDFEALQQKIQQLEERIQQLEQNQ